MEAAGLKVLSRVLSLDQALTDASLCAYLSVLAELLVADHRILPELQLLIGEESRADAAKVTQQAGQLFLQTQQRSVTTVLPQSCSLIRPPDKQEAAGRRQTGSRCKKPLQRLTALSVV